MSQPHHEVQKTLAQLADQILHDPVLLEQLCDRIYDLLINEIRLQQERYPYRRF